MRAHSDKYLENLTNITGNDAVRGILQDSQFAMAGIMYYVGKLLRKLHKEGIYVENHVPDIYVGGNGSRIFYWLVGGSIFRDSNTRMGVLKKILQEAAGFEEKYDVKIYLSERPKIEVASGMITERPRHQMRAEEETAEKLFGDTEDEYIINSVLAGESFNLNGESKAEDDFISAREISAGIDITNIDEFNAFVEEFNKNKKSVWLNGIEYDEGKQSDLKKAVLNYYVAEKGKNIKEVYVEPVYITALKKMMEMMGR